MTLNVDKYLIPLLLLVFAYAVSEVWDMPIEARLFPWIIGFVGLGFLIWLLFRGLWNGGSEAEEKPESSADFAFTAEEASEKGRRNAWETFGWIYGFVLVLWLVGFHIAIPLMVFLYLVRSGERWTITIGLTAGAGVVLWGIFDRLLHLPFPPGVFFDWLGWS